MDKLKVINEKLLDECIEYLKDETKYHNHIDKCINNMINLEKKFQEFNKLTASLDPDSIKFISKM